MRRLANGQDILSFLFLASHRTTQLFSPRQIRWLDGRRFNLPIGRAMVAVLCSFESRGQQLIDFDQQAEGCVLLAKMPLKLLSATGELAVDLRKEGGGSGATAGVRIPGMRSHRTRSVRKTIDALYSDIPRIASLDQHL
jgi:hypothetical protein